MKTDIKIRGQLVSAATAVIASISLRAADLPDIRAVPLLKERSQQEKQRIHTEQQEPTPAGYRTGIVGKWHLGYDSKFHPMNQGFDEFRGYVGGAVDYHTHVSISGLQKLDWWQGKKIENERGYTTDLLTRYATDFIARYKDVPFFIYLADEAPHTPLQGRDPTKKKSREDTYKEMIEVLDESVGKVEEALREHHQKEKSLVIFCMRRACPDHGLLPNGCETRRGGASCESPD